jgi:glycine/D-amino acid oxidase-like deaminating enzyme
MLSRRAILKLAATPLLLGRAPAIRRAPRVVVVGAGAFGGWTAWWLTRRGVQVTLLDAWGPGNMRASSGGETRVIRGSYGDRAIYTKMAARALTLWREHERQWQRTLYLRTGALWMFGGDDGFARSSARAMAAAGFPLERPSVAEAGKRWPQINFDGIVSVMFEPEAGYLLARQSCAAVVEQARAAGAAFRIGAARPFTSDTAIDRVPLESGDALPADTVVYACGPWLGPLFPDVIGARIRPTRQETFYFGPAPGDPRFTEEALPVWVDYRERLIYGIPGNANRGFKLADDTLGETFDPTAGDRRNSPEQIEAARAFLRLRFPALADAPLLGGEVCQYENSPDSHFIIDRHPRAANVWIVGGGSGHGFKMGPALGEMVADLVLSDGTPDPAFRLSRFPPAQAPGVRSRFSNQGVPANARFAARQSRIAKIEI